MTVPDHYRVRRSYFTATILAPLSLAIVVNIMDLSLWAKIASLCLFVAATGYRIITERKMKAAGSGTIKMDENGIRIMDGRGVVVRSFGKGSIVKLEVSGNYAIPGDTLADISKEMIGKPIENFLVVHDPSGAHRFDFEISTHYMISRLTAFLDSCAASGIEVSTYRRAA